MNQTLEHAPGLVTVTQSHAEVQSRLAAIVESSDDAIISKTLDGVILTWNRGAERVFGYTASEVVGAKLSLLVPPDRADEVTTILQRVRRGERVDHFETIRRRKDGTDINISVTISPILGEGGVVVAASKVARDITTQKTAILERDRFFELSIDMICSATLDGSFTRVNPAFSAVLGWGATELVGHRIVDFIHPNDVAATELELGRLREGKPSTHFESRFRGRSGEHRWLSWRSAAHASGTFYAVLRDVTEEKAAQAAIASALREKEVLLQEVHHRVKNNLQVIMSLINMQIRSLDTKTAHDALSECQSRIQAIALIHEKLYQSKNFGSVPFAEYVATLLDNLRAVVGKDNEVTFDLAIGDFQLPLDKAIPCALMLNELLVNALKHAFPDRPGRVRVEMQADETDASFSVSDDGVGFVPGFDIWQSNTLGLQLVCTLAEQLGAEITLGSSVGATVSMRFPLRRIDE